MGLRRWAGVGGVVVVVLLVAVNLAQGASGRPFTGAGEEGYLADYLEFYADADWLPILYAFTVPFIWIALAVFAAGLAGSLMAPNRAGVSYFWPIVGVVGVTMQNSIFPAVISFDVAQFRTVAEVGALDLGLHRVHLLLFEVNSISLAIALLGFSAAMLHRGMAGTWLPRIGLAGAALLVVSFVNIGFELDAIGAVGFLGFILWLVFIAIASSWLLRQPSDHAELPASGAPPDRAQPA